MLDRKVQAFLERHRDSWADLNVPESDGRILFDYFKALYPKLTIGGCYAAHNVSGSRGVGGWQSGSQRFYEYVIGLPDVQTSVDLSGRGMSISTKKAKSHRPQSSSPR
jgi:caffeoyl-CoA O-methyltransferase